METTAFMVTMEMTRSEVNWATIRFGVVPVVISFMVDQGLTDSFHRLAMGLTRSLATT